VGSFLQRNDPAETAAVTDDDIEGDVAAAWTL
jgi:hypothetical protein